MVLVKLHDAFRIPLECLQMIRGKKVSSINLSLIYPPGQIKPFKNDKTFSISCYKVEFEFHSHLLDHRTIISLIASKTLSVSCSLYN